MPPLVLLANEDDVWLCLYEALLTGAGYAVVAGRSASECLGLLAGHKPDAALLDLDLPSDLDGGLALVSALLDGPTPTALLSSGPDPTAVEAVPFPVLCCAGGPLPASQVLNVVRGLVQSADASRATADADTATPTPWRSVSAPVLASPLGADKRVVRG